MGANQSLISDTENDNNLLSPPKQTVQYRVRKSEPNIRASLGDSNTIFTVENDIYPEKKYLSVTKLNGPDSHMSSPNSSIPSFTGSRELEGLSSSRQRVMQDKNDSGKVHQPVPDDIDTLENLSSEECNDDEDDDDISVPSDHELDLIISQLLDKEEVKRMKDDFLKIQEKLRKYYHTFIKETVKLEMIGQGKHAKIYRAFHKGQRKFYALKIIEIRNKQDAVKGLKEITALSKVQDFKNNKLIHAYDIEYNYTKEQNDTKFNFSILMELGAGTLEQYANFKYEKQINWEENELINILWLMIQHFSLLKSYGVYLRDVKPSHILISQTFEEFKFIDFENAFIVPKELMDSKKTRFELEMPSTTFFLAPEIYDDNNSFNTLKKQKFDPSLSDIYSIGLTILKICDPNLDRSKLNKTLDRIKKKFPHLHRYLQDLLDENPEERGVKFANVENELHGKPPGFAINDNKLFAEYLFEKVMMNLERDHTITFITTLRNLFILKEAEAVAQYRIVEESDFGACSPFMESLRYQKGLCLLDSGLYEKAIEEFKMACEIHEMLKKGEDLMIVKVYDGMGKAYKNQGKYIEALEMFKKVKHIKVSYYGEKNVETANAYQNIGNTFLAQGDLQKAEKFLNEALEIKKEVLGPMNIEIASALESMGSLFEHQGRFENALDFYKKALIIKNSHFGPIHPGVAQAHHHIGSIYQAQGKYNQAVCEYEKALEGKKSCLGEDHLEVALTLNNLGIVYKHLGRNSDALKMYYKSLNIKMRLLGAKHPEVALSYHNIGTIYLLQKDYSQALEKFQESYEINASHYGEDHPTTALSYLNIASVYQAQQNYPVGIRNYNKALKILTDHHGEYHPDVALIYNNLGAIYEKLGQHKEALEKYQYSLSIKMKLYGEKHPSIAATYNNIGLVYDKQGKYIEALDQYKKALDIKIQHYGESHPSVASTYNNAGLAYYKMGKTEIALEYYEKALSIKVGSLGNDHLSVADALSNIGNTYKSQGKKPEARKSLLQALEIYNNFYSSLHPKVEKLRKSLDNLKS